MLGITEEAHQALLDQLWKKKEILRNMDQLASFYAQFGVDKDKFIATSRSFAVDGKLRREQLAVQEWGIRGTPALVLNGRYRIQAGAAVPNYETMLSIVDHLIELDADRLPADPGPEVEAAD
jgi:thiol:disulfide interchange protein DsbA